MYSTVPLFWRLFRLYVCIHSNTYIIQNYRTIVSIRPPTVAASPFIRGSVVYTLMSE